MRPCSLNTRPAPCPGLVLALFLVCTISPQTGAAQERRVPEIEQALGATLSAAAIGNGRLSACFSRTGTVTSLRWPHTSHWEVLDHTTEASSEARDRPRFGADENEGVFLGLAHGTGEDRSVSWLRDAAWTCAQSYGADDTSTLVTTCSHATLGVTVETSALVARVGSYPLDVLALQAELRGFEELVEPGIVFYENLAPAGTREPGVPLEWSDLGERDTGCIWSEEDQGLLHAYFEGMGDGELMGISPDEVQTWLADVDARADKDARFFLMGAEGPVVDFQCGRLGFSSETFEQEAYLDAADGQLQGGTVAGPEGSGALQVAITPGNPRATFYLAAGGSLDEARSVLDSARSAGFSTLRRETEEDDRRWLALRDLPVMDDPEHTLFVLRTLLSLRTVFDHSTAAMVASLSNNPPYALDWPRDGAFYNLLLNVSGYDREALFHTRYLAAQQRLTDGEQPNLVCDQREDGRDFSSILGTCEPAGSWSMNTYADGTVGGPIGFEIDQVGLGLWALTEQLIFVPRVGQRAELLESLYPNIKLAADLLVRCRDPETGLLCFAYEDDQYELSQGQQGTLAALAGLRGAVMAAELAGEDDDAQRWQARWEELAALFEEHWLVLDEPLPHLGVGGAWAGEAVFPSGLWPLAEVSVDQQAAYLLEELSAPGTLLSRDESYVGGQYDAKAVWRLALLWPADSPSGELVRPALDLLAKEIPLPGTRHLGEHYIWEDYDGDGVPEWHASTATPHVWQASLVALSLIAWYDPDRFGYSHDAADHPVVAPPFVPEDPGCGCLAGAQASPPSSLLLLPLALIGRRRRSALPDQASRSAAL